MSTGRRASKSTAFVSDRERDILSAAPRLATSNPFLPDRIDQERRALGSDFVQYAEVWHMDGVLEGMNPNLAKISPVAEQLADALPRRVRPRNQDAEGDADPDEAYGNDRADQAP